jgi:hypothetical protein
MVKMRPTFDAFLINTYPTGMVMFKFLLPLFAVTAITSTANAFELEPSDSSEFTKACVAAVESNSSLEDVLRQNNIRTISQDQVLCNETPIADFARAYRKATKSNTNINVIFEEATQSYESKLCIAAATSNVEFTKAKLATNVNPSEVACNGMALAKFAKQYNKAFNG